MKGIQRMTKERERKEEREREKKMREIENEKRTDRELKRLPSKGEREKKNFHGRRKIYLHRLEPERVREREKKRERENGRGRKKEREREMERERERSAFHILRLTPSHEIAMKIYCFSMKEWKRERERDDGTSTSFASTL